MECHLLVTKGFILTLKAKFVADGILIFFFFFYFSEKTSPDISCESSAKQMIHMKCHQDLLSLKNKKNNKNWSSAAVVIGVLSVNRDGYTCHFYKGDKYCDFMFVILHTKPVMKRDLL